MFPGQSAPSFAIDNPLVGVGVYDHVMSMVTYTYTGSIPYRTSKAAVNMLMRSAAIDLKPRGIACVVINPGWVRTDMGGPNARLSPEESVGAMRGLIAKLGPDDSGRFYNYDGREYPW